MDYKEAIQVLEDFHSELLKNSPFMSTIILIADHETGECRYYDSGFIEEQALLLKMLLEKNKVLAAHFYYGMLRTEKGS